MQPSAPPAAPPDRTTAPAVEVRDLRRRYGDFEAVRGISFEVQPGEVFALLGVNGAGKTSALEVLEGLAPAQSGSVRVLGADPVRATGPACARTSASSCSPAACPVT